jgi:hypothetical protein
MILLDSTIWKALSFDHDCVEYYSFSSCTGTNLSYYDRSTARIIRVEDNNADHLTPFDLLNFSSSYMFFL